MNCFRQIYLLIKSPFKRTQHQVLEIGPPMDFRKEELPQFVADDDAITLYNPTALEKDTVVNTTEKEPSTRDKIKNQVRRLSVKISRPPTDSE
ncbi:hypothetical protein BJX63DRAFT_435610 [Aspergillus granulosus]|uniref:Uncharacterized protein n=1 Tax=Aspergillus granulosus TaxID=176169 RepID=A0ABR4H0M7_9EURO